MLPDRLRACLLIGVACYFILILLFLKKKSISLKYTLLWIFAGLFMGVLIVWPQLLRIIVSIIGIESNMNGLFSIVLIFIIAILMSLTSIVSKQKEKIKSLTQTMAMMEKRIRELEKIEER